MKFKCLQKFQNSIIQLRKALEPPHGSKSIDTTKWTVWYLRPRPLSCQEHPEH